MAPAPCVAWSRWQKHTHPMVYIRKAEAMASAPCMTWPRWRKHTLRFTSFFLPWLQGEPKVSSFLQAHFFEVFFFFFFKETYLGGKVMRVDAVCLFLSIPSFCALLYALDLYALCWGHSGSCAGGRKKSEAGGLCGCLFPLLLAAGPQLPASLWIFRVIAAPTPLATENYTVAWDFTQRITVNGLFFLFVGLRMSQVAQVGPSQLRMTLRSHSSCIYLPSA